jgi:hypothetical protein
MYQIRTIRHLYPLWISLTLMIGGCARPQENITEATQSELISFADDFYEAVSAHDANRVYQMIAHRDMDLDFFKARFEKNYAVFLENAERLRDEAIAGNIEIYSQRVEDPCGFMRFEPTHDNHWQLQHVPNSNAAQPPEAIKKSLISLVQTYQFLAKLDAYALSHPELNATKLRHLKRYIAYNELTPDDIVFSGPVATIILDDMARITLICDAKEWRLSQCIFTP